METARKYRDRRSQVSMADAVEAAAQAADVAAAVERERQLAAAAWEQRAETTLDDHGLANVDGVAVCPDPAISIATFGDWTIRFYAEQEMYDAVHEGSCGITTGYRNVIDLVSDLRSGHHG